MTLTQISVEAPSLSTDLVEFSLQNLNLAIHLLRLFAECVGDETRPGCLKFDREWERAAQRPLTTNQMKM